jgi:hypothetical protein
VIGAHVQRRRGGLGEVISRPPLVLTLIPRTYVPYIRIQSIRIDVGLMEDGIWSNLKDGTSSSVSSVELSPHEVPRAEGNIYYAGIGPNGRGPKLIYRTSDDKFVEPEWPDGYKRLMKLCPVPEDHELGQDGRWDRIRDKARGSFSAQHSVN